VSEPEGGIGEKERWPRIKGRARSADRSAGGEIAQEAQDQTEQGDIGREGAPRDGWIPIKSTGLASSTTQPPSQRGACDRFSPCSRRPAPGPTFPEAIKAGIVVMVKASNQRGASRCQTRGASRCQTLFLVFSLTIGLSRADRVPNLTRRLDALLKASSELCDDLTEIVEGASAPAA